LECREVETMFFTHMGRVVAILALVLGIILIASGAHDYTKPYDLELTRWWGRLIERGIYAVLFGVAFGILTEISYALKSLKVP
jgi:hypothetical protein